MSVMYVMRSQDRVREMQRVLGREAFVVAWGGGTYARRATAVVIVDEMPIETERMYDWFQTSVLTRLAPCGIVLQSGGGA